jgi:predicted N-acyltransferase
MIGALLSIHATIRDVDESRWDELAGDNAFATRAWLLTIEESWRAKAVPLYVTYSQGHALTAAAASYVVEPSPQVETLDDIIFGRLAPAMTSLGLSRLPALVCVPGLGYGWHVGVRSHTTGTEARAATAAVVEALEREADARGLGLHFTHVLEAERDLRAVLEARRYVRGLNVPVSVLDLSWPTLDGYLQSLSRKTRKELRRQMNRNRDSGTRIDVLGAGDDTVSDERLLQLLDGNTRKHDDRRFPCGTAFTALLRRSLAWVFVARRNQRTTGVSVALRQRDALFVQSVGVDPEALNDYTYFQLAYYSPIERAIASGVRRIYFGRGAYEMKLRRGCSTRNTWVYSRVSGPSRMRLAAWQRVASVWNHWKLPAEARRALTG